MSTTPDDDFEQLSVAKSPSGAGGDTKSFVTVGGSTSGGQPSRGMSLKSRAIGYLSRREHSRLELERKLQRYADPDNPSELQRLLDELEKGNWLSNQRFAQSLVNRKASGKGAAVILNELRQHRLPDADIEPVREQLKATEYQRAKAVWERKFGQPPIDAREYARQVRFLASRGFSPAVLRRILGDLDDFTD